MTKLFCCALVGLFALCGCGTISSRTQERLAAYSSMSAKEHDLIQHGQIEQGMDTNAVYIAWGKPSAVTSQPSPADSGTDQTWWYYGHRPVLVPNWAYLPDRYGNWTLSYTPDHYSVQDVKGEVNFHNDRVVNFRKY